MPSTSRGVPSAELLQIVAAATQAPSSHNTQPWLFRAGPASLELWADRTRALPVNDPDDRELVISCGCALFNARVAAEALGWASSLRVLPDRDAPDLLARLAFEPSPGPTGRAGLQAGIARRRTCRHRFAPQPPDAGTVAALCDAAAREGATLTVLDGAARQEAARCVAEADQAQWADPRWRRELAAWMHPRRQGDGLPVPPWMAPLAQRFVSSFDLGHAVGAKDRDLAGESPLLTVLSTEGDATSDRLRGGMALEHALLVAALRGVQASYLNQPVQVGTLRARLQTLTGRPGHAQLLVRWGTPAVEQPRAPRRPLAEVWLED